MDAVPRGQESRSNFSQLNGTIPSDLCSATKMTSIDISHNSLTGALPSCMGNLSQLTSIQLQQNRLTGPLFDSIGNLTLLSTLDLVRLHSCTDSNDESFCDSFCSMDEAQSTNVILSSLPASIGNCTSLKKLDLQANSFFGARIRFRPSEEHWKFSF